MDLYRLIRPLLFSLPPETAHRVTHRAGEAISGTALEKRVANRYRARNGRLRLTVFDQEFPSPIGVAAGFDKNARIPGLLAGLGFGHVEIGGITARPQRGNPRPRLFRLTADEGLINRMGFNNEGADRIAGRLATTPHPSVPLGVNLGKSKGVPPEFAPADYRYTYERLASHGDFFVINVSSPNTPGLRELQARAQLERIVETLQAAGADPLLVKLSPDLTPEAVSELIEVIVERDLAGIVATNTTVKRSADLRDPHRAQRGGLSGRPVEARSTEVIREIATQTSVPIIGVGGVFSGEDAYRKLRAGATLVQLYTGIIYRGPGVARKINQELIDCLDRDGFEHVSEVIGIDVENH